MYVVTDTRIDCQNDLGYKIEGLKGWWTHDLFQEVNTVENINVNKIEVTDSNELN